MNNLPENWSKIMAEIIKKDTWDKGLPQYYMNKEGWLVEHHSDGRIIKIKKLK